MAFQEVECVRVPAPRVEGSPDDDAVVCREVGDTELVGEVPQTMFNTFVVSLGTTVLNLILGSLAGYGYARFGRFRFMQGTLIVLMVTRMLPGLALLIPFFIFYRTLGLIDTKIGLIVA